MLTILAAIGLVATFIGGYNLLRPTHKARITEATGNNTTSSGGKTQAPSITVERARGASDDENFSIRTLTREQVIAEFFPGSPQPESDKKSQNHLGTTTTQLNVPFADKDAAKAAGAKWDQTEKTWYVPAGVSLDAFRKWLPSYNLTLELVPESCWFSNVRSNVTSEQWDMLRKHTYTQAGHKCEICGARGQMNAHEVWSYNDWIRVQKLERLVCLCSDCHRVKHFGLANINGETEIALTHLAKVNRWSVPQAEKYVEEQFKIWQHRSTMTWSLDVTWLEQFDILINVRVR